MIDLRYRMYGLVPSSLSKIQKAIQYGHALQEYNNMMFEELFKEKWAKEAKSPEFAAFQKWANEDKTFVLLDGGSTNKRELVKGADYPQWENGVYYEGTLNNHVKNLKENGVRVATFEEPDLGDQITAVVFLVDERVWDTNKYPDRDPSPQPESVEISPGVFETPAVFITPETMHDYKKRLGGEQNAWLRVFLRKFKLA